MNKMRKFVGVVLAVALVLSFSACGAASSDNIASDIGSAESEVFEPDSDVGDNQVMPVDLEVDYREWPDNEFTRTIPELKGDMFGWGDALVDDDFYAQAVGSKEYYLAYIQEMMAMGWYATTYDGDKGEGNQWKAHNDSTDRDIEVNFTTGNLISVAFPKKE
jgi:hypothetical protein